MKLIHGRSFAAGGRAVSRYNFRSCERVQLKFCNYSNSGFIHNDVRVSRARPRYFTFFSFARRGYILSFPLINPRNRLYTLIHTPLLNHSYFLPPPRVIYVFYKHCSDEYYSIFNKLFE